jgi:hypothetical protein
LGNSLRNNCIVQYAPRSHLQCTRATTDAAVEFDEFIEFDAFVEFVVPDCVVDVLLLLVLLTAAVVIIA